MGWRDVVAGQRAPQVPPAGDTESAIVLLDGPGLVDVSPAERAAALALDGLVVQMPERQI